MRNVYNIPLIERAHEFSGNTAIIDKHGEYTYGEILDSAKNVAACILNGKDDIREARIVFMVPSSFCAWFLLFQCSLNLSQIHDPFGDCA